jgi:hypothetical protein
VNSPLIMNCPHKGGGEYQLSAVSDQVLRLGAGDLLSAKLPTSLWPVPVWSLDTELGHPCWPQLRLLLLCAAAAGTQASSVAQAAVAAVQQQAWRCCQQQQRQPGGTSRAANQSQEVTPAHQFFSRPCVPLVWVCATTHMQTCPPSPWW